MTTNPALPVPAGTVVQVTCDIGPLLGDEAVTCLEDVTYSYSAEPACIIGKCKRIAPFAFQKMAACNTECIFCIL